MPLNDLNKQLYSGSDSKELASRTHEQSEYDPSLVAPPPLSPFDEQQQWNRPQKGLTSEQKKKLYIGLGVFVVVLLLIGAFFLYGWWTKNAFHQDRVTISFEGLKEADSTQLMKYVIHYENNNRVTLKDAFIQLNYAENFQPIDNLNLKFLSPTSSKIFIGDIKPMAKNSIELKGVFYAPKDFPVYLNGEIHFTPSNGASELFIGNKIGVVITGSPLALSVAAPRQAVDGDNVEYVVSYKNRDSRSIANAEARIVFPQGFELKNSQPKASENGSVWYLGNLESEQGGEIRIQGKLKGNDSDGKNIVVTLGHMSETRDFVTYDKQEFSTRMVNPVLTVLQRVENKDNDIVNAGENLKYAVMFKNTGSAGLRDAILTVEIKGKIFDFSKLTAEKGFYDSAKNTISWKASDVPALASINPNGGGTVYFTVPIKSVIPVESKLDKNFTVSSVAKIDSPDIPTPLDSNKIIGSNTLDLRLASKVLFDTKAYYTDSKIKNTGPIPMATGQETTFAIHWTVASVSNDVGETSVTSSLPSGLRWTGQIYPSNEKISYNDRTNQIVWDAGDVSAGTGILSPPREVVFQVGVIPQGNQIGNPINLINKSIFTAKDSFINQGLTLEGEAKNTQLYEDPTVGFVNGKVAR